jgi:hypothetical protein
MWVVPDSVSIDPAFQQLGRLETGDAVRLTLVGASRLTADRTEGPRS